LQVDLNSKVENVLGIVLEMKNNRFNGKIALHLAL
jgi:hypothetical protein